MTGRKENKQKGTRSGLIRKISALAIAILLVITGTQVDWKSLVPSANAGFLQTAISVPSDSYIGQTAAEVGSQTGRSMVNTVTLWLSATESVTPEMDAEGNIINYISSVTDTATVAVVGMYKTPGMFLQATGDNLITSPPIKVDNIALTDQPTQVDVDVSSVNANLLAGECIGVVAKVTSGNDKNIIVYSDPNNYNGWTSANEKGYFQSTTDLMQITMSASTVPIPQITPDTNVIGDYLVLAPGNEFDLIANVGDSIARSPKFEIVDNTSNSISLGTVYDNSVKINALKDGTATVKVSGEGIAEKTITVRVDSASIANATYSGTPTMGTITTTVTTGAITIPVVGRPTNAGTYYVNITGDQTVAGSNYDVSHYQQPATFTIDPIDINTTGITSSDLTFRTNPENNQVISASFTWNGNTYYLDTDFTAVAEPDSTNPREVTSNPPKVTYKYDVTLTGKNNFKDQIKLTGCTFTEDYTAKRILDVYDIALNSTQIIWSGTGDATQPTITFFNKLSGESKVVTPGMISTTPIPGLNIAYDTVASNRGPGAVKITPDTAASYFDPSDSVTLPYIVKQNIESSTDVVVTLSPASYVETPGTNSYEPRPTIKLATEDITENFTWTYQNNTAATDNAVVLIQAKPDSYFVGNLQAKFAIYPPLNSAHTKVSIGGAATEASYGTFANKFLTGYIGTYTGAPVKVTKDMIEIKVDDRVLNPILYDIVDAGFGHQIEGEPTPYRTVDGVNAGPDTGSVLIRTTEEYGRQYLRVYFGIRAVDISDVRINLGSDPNAAQKFSEACTYTGSPITIDGLSSDIIRIVVTDKNGIEVPSTGYDIIYGVDDEGNPTNINVGDAIFTVKGKGNHGGEKSTKFHIYPCNINDTNVTVDPIGPQSYIGPNQPVQPGVTATYKGRALIQGEDGDYTLTYSNNTAITTTKRAQAIIHGTGNFTGTRTELFDIVPKNITNNSVEFIMQIGTQTFRGNASGPGSILNTGISVEYDGSRKVPTLVIKDGSNNLENGTDYYIRPMNNVNTAAESAANPPTLEVFGINNYGQSLTDSVKVRFSITPKSISAVTVTGNNGNQIKVVDTANKDHQILIRDVDYRILNADGTPFTGYDDAPGKYTYIIEGIGNYKERKEVEFFSGTDVNDANLFALYPLDGIAQRINGSGSLLPNFFGEDKPLKFLIVTDSAAYASNVTVGAIKADDILGAVDTNEIKVTYTPETGFKADTAVTATIEGTGGNYYGTRTVNYTVKAAHMEWPPSGSTTYRYSDDYSVTINGATVERTKVTLKGAPGKYEPDDPGSLNSKPGSEGYYVATFTYTGKVIDAKDIDVKMLLEPKNQTDIPKLRYDFSDEIPVDVTVEGKLDLTQDNSNENNVTKLKSIKLIGGGNFTGTRTIYYRVIPTQIDDPTNPGEPAAGFSVSGINASYPYKGEEYTDADFPNLQVKFGDIILQKGKDYELKFGKIVTDPATSATTNKWDNENVLSGGAIAIVGKDFYGGTITKNFSITPIAITDAELKNGNEWTYESGAPIPTIGAVTCTNAGLKGSPRTLTLDDDYTITGSATAADATATLGPKEFIVKGKDNYTGEIKKTYTVFANLNDGQFSITNLDGTTGTPTYKKDTSGIKGYDAGTGNINIADADITNGHTGLTLTKGTHYTVGYDTNPTLNGKITIKGNPANYVKGELTQSVKIYGDLSLASVAGIDDTYAYTGKVITPGPTVAYFGTPLNKDTDYEVEYGANSTAGKETGTVTIKGKAGSAYAYPGEDSKQEKKFNIKYDLSKAKVTVEPSEARYTGSAIVPTNVTVTVEKQPLTVTTHYKVEYENNVDVGTANVKIVPEDDYSFNSYTGHFEILPIDSADGQGTFSVDITKSFPYRGSEIVPTVSDIIVKYDDGSGSGPKPIDKKWYKVTGGNKNINVTSGNTAEVYIELQGNYKGSLTGYFAIDRKSLTSADIVVTADDVVYTGEAANPAIKVMDKSSGYILVKGKDYTVDTITAKNVSETPVTVTVKGKGNYQDDGSGSFSILPLDLSSGVVRIGNSDFTYDGNAVTADKLGITFTVTAEKKTITIPNDELNFAITGDRMTSGQAINAGDYTVTVSQKNPSDPNYEGEATATFTIKKKEMSNALLGTGYATDIEVDSNGLVLETNLRKDNDYDTNPDSGWWIKDEKLITLKDTGVPAGRDILYKPDGTGEATAEYSGNKMAGIATMTYTPREDGNYTGSISYRFRIGKLLEEEGKTTIALTEPGPFIYDGSIQAPEKVEVSYDGVGQLTEGVDYTVDTIPSSVNVGKYTVTVRGMGKSYGGSKTVEYEIKPKGSANLTSTIDLPNNSMVFGEFTKEELARKIQVYDRDRNAPLAASDFEVKDADWKNLDKVGTASYTVTLKGNYTGTLPAGSFKVTAVKADGNAKIEFDSNYQYSEYNGNKQTPPIKVTYNGITLQQGKDYDTPLYEDNTLPGQGMVTVTLKGNYQGYATEFFPIYADISNDDYVLVDAVDRRYTGNPIDAKGVSVVLQKVVSGEKEDVKVLREGVDYTVSGPNPIGGDWSRAKRAEVTVEAMPGSNYFGTKNVIFNIIENLPEGYDPDDPEYEDPHPQPVDDSLTVNGFTAKTNATVGTTVDLNWTRNSRATRYYLSWVGGGNTDGIGPLPSSTTRYSVTGLNPNTTYTFNITAENDDGKGPVSSATATTGSGSGPGPTPGGKEIFLQATANGTTVSLGWAGNNVVGADSYEITWTPATNGGRLRLNGGETHAINIENLSPNTTYTFNIQAMSGTTVIASGKQDVTTGSGGGTSPLSPVTGVQVKNNGGSSNTLSWTPRTNITGYNIYRSTSQGTRGGLIASMTSNYGAYTDTIGLQRGYRYYYTIVPFIRTSGVIQEGTPSTQIYVDVR